MIAGKVWGSTELLLATPTCEVHRLIIEPQRQCSMHRHKRKWNAFYCVTGRLFLDVEKADYALTDITELGPGMTATIPPGEFHRFRTVDAPCEALEIYYLDALGADIERRDHGGVAILKTLLTLTNGGG